MRRLPPASCHRDKKEALVYNTPLRNNLLCAEAECMPEADLPLDVFPNSIQDLILNLARYENFNVEYTASIILSAVATPVGFG